MAELTTQGGSRQYLKILRQHVLDPLSTAKSITKRERDEVDSEREAFEQFATAIVEVPTISPETSGPPTGNVLSKAPIQKSDDLSKAYRETVMAVPHYDDTYGEALEENLVAEFGPELAELFQSTGDPSFTDYQKESLVVAAEERARNRAEFCNTLDSEIDSLESFYRDLSSLLDELDTSVVPAWYHQQFEDQLEDMLHARQSTLSSRSSMAHIDRHNLCAYLYDDEFWTYPGLTAVARLLDSVVVRDRD